MSLRSRIFKAKAVRYWQEESAYHPLTCPLGHGNLFYKDNGLRCKHCTYEQDIPYFVAQKYKEALNKRKFHIKPFFKWFDLWIGIYIDKKKHAVYIIPFPMFGIKIWFEYPNPYAEILNL